MQNSTVLAKDSKDNAIATATAAAGADGQKYIITGINASYSVSTVGGLLQLKDGNTVVFEQYVHGSANISFDKPIEGSNKTAFSAVLAASGMAGQIGKVNLIGYLY